MGKYRWLILTLVISLGLGGCGGLGGAGVDGAEEKTKEAAVVPSISFPEDETEPEKEAEGSYWDSVRQKNKARLSIGGTDAFYMEEEEKKTPENVIHFQILDLIDGATTVYAYQAVRDEAAGGKNGMVETSSKEAPLISRLMVYNTKTKEHKCLFEQENTVRVIRKNGKIQTVAPVYDTRTAETNQLLDLFAQKMQTEDGNCYFVYYGGICTFYQMENGNIRVAHSRNINPDLALAIKKYKEEFQTRFGAETGKNSPAISIEGVTADPDFNVFLHLSITKSKETAASSAPPKGADRETEITEEEARKKAEEAKKQAEDSVKSLDVLVANYAGSFGGEEGKQVLSVPEFESQNENYEEQFDAWYTQVDGETFEDESEVPDLEDVKRTYPDKFAAFSNQEASFEEMGISISLRSEAQTLAALPSYVSSDWKLSELSLDEKTSPYITGSNAKEYGGSKQNLAVQMTWEDGGSTTGFLAPGSEIDINSLKDEVKTQKRTYYIESTDEEGHKSVTVHHDTARFIVKKQVSLKQGAKLAWTLAREDSRWPLFSPMKGNVLYSRENACRLTVSDRKTLRESGNIAGPEIAGELRSIAASQKIGSQGGMVYGIFSDRQAVFSVWDISGSQSGSGALYGVSNWALQYDSSQAVDASDRGSGAAHTEPYTEASTAFQISGNELWFYGAGLNGVMKCRLNRLTVPLNGQVEVQEQKEEIPGGQIAPYCSYGIWLSEDQKSCMVIGFPTDRYSDYTAQEIIYAKLFQLDLDSEEVSTRLVKSALAKGSQIYQKYIVGETDLQDELLKALGLNVQNKATQYAREYYQMQRKIYRNQVNSYQNFLTLSGVTVSGTDAQEKLLKKLAAVRSTSALERLIYDLRSDLQKEVAEESAEKTDTKNSAELSSKAEELEAVSRVQKKLADAAHYSSDEWDAQLSRIVDDFNPPDSVSGMRIREALDLFSELAGVRRRDSMENDINACSDYQDMEQLIVSYYAGKGAAWDALLNADASGTSGEREETEDQKAARIIRERKAYTLEHMKVTQNGKKVSLEEKYGTGWWKKVLEEILDIVKEKNKAYNEAKDKALETEGTESGQQKPEKGK